MKSNKMIEYDFTPLIDYAIGALADFAGSIGYARVQMAKLKQKRMWSLSDLERLELAIKKTASVVDQDYKKWEEEVDVRIAEAKKRLRRMEGS